jgi:hypothetical protein
MTYAGVVRLKKSDLDTFILEESLALSEVQRGVVRSSVPDHDQHTSFPSGCKAHQLVKKVILSVDILT